MISDDGLDHLADFVVPVDRQDTRYLNEPSSVVLKAARRGLISGPTLIVPKAPRPKAAAVERVGTAATELSTVETKWVDITPGMAREWLRNNFNNRPISRHTVSAYAREMKRKLWIPTHQGIAFNMRDELIDGQHRLYAIIESGMTVRMMVTYGMPVVIRGKRMTGMDAVDRGRPRSVADQLKIQHGLLNGSVINMICLRIAGICVTEKTKKLTVSEVLDIYSLFERQVNWIVDRRPKAHGIKQAGVLGGFAFALASEAEEDGLIAEMFERLTSTAPAKVGTMPMAHLRAYLTSDEAILLRSGDDRALAELVLQAVYLEQLGKPIEQLEMSRKGVEHFRELNAEKVEKVREIFEGGNAE